MEGVSYISVSTTFSRGANFQVVMRIWEIVVHLYKKLGEPYEPPSQILICGHPVQIPSFISTEQSKSVDSKKRDSQWHYSARLAKTFAEGVSRPPRLSHFLKKT